jgi:hypothetical protein
MNSFSISCTCWTMSIPDHSGNIQSLEIDVIQFFEFVTESTVPELSFERSKFYPTV